MLGSAPVNEAGARYCRTVQVHHVVARGGDAGDAEKQVIAVGVDEAHQAVAGAGPGAPGQACGISYPSRYGIRADQGRHGDLRAGEGSLRLRRVVRARSGSHRAAVRGRPRALAAGVRRAHLHPVGGGLHQPRDFRLSVRAHGRQAGRRAVLDPVRLVRRVGAALVVAQVVVGNGRTVVVRRRPGHLQLARAGRLRARHRGRGRRVRRLLWFLRFHRRRRARAHHPADDRVHSRTGIFRADPHPVLLARHQIREDPAAGRNGSGPGPESGEIRVAPIEFPLLHRHLRGPGVDPGRPAHRDLAGARARNGMARRRRRTGAAGGAACIKAHVHPAHLGRSGGRRTRAPGRRRRGRTGRARSARRRPGAGKAPRQDAPRGSPRRGGTRNGPSRVRRGRAARCRRKTWGKRSPPDGGDRISGCSRSLSNGGFAAPAGRGRRDTWRQPHASEGDGDGPGRPGCGRSSALGSRLSALGSRLSALGSRLSALGSRLSALGSRLSALGSRLSALGSRLSALGSRLSALGSRLSALGSRLSALGSRLSALGSRLSALGSRLSALGSRLSALGSRLSALGSRLSALGSRLSALGSRLSALGSRLSALGSRLSALGSRLSALGSRLSALGSRLSALGSRLSALSALGSRLSALGSRLSALGSRLSALGSRLSALGSRLSALGSRLSALGSRLSALGSRLSALGSLILPASDGNRDACVSEGALRRRSVKKPHVHPILLSPHARPPQPRAAGHAHVLHAPRHPRARILVIQISKNLIPNPIRSGTPAAPVPPPRPAPTRVLRRRTPAGTMHRESRASAFAGPLEKSRLTVNVILHTALCNDLCADWSITAALQVQSTSQL